MADVTIEAAAHSASFIIANRGCVFWTTSLIGYVIYVDANNDLVYRKTTDGGVNWSAANALVTGTVFAYDCWADWQTKDDAGTKIHFACVDDSSDDILYGYLDTSDDSEYTGKIEDCQGTGAIYVGIERIIHYISIAKTRGGNLAVACRYRDANATATYFYIFYTSPDGATWTSKTSPWEAANADYILLFPANLVDNQDLWGVFWDASANEISLKTYDNSNNDWTTIAEASIATSMAEAVYYLQMDGVIRLSDGHLLLAAWNLYDNVTSDLMTWDITDAGTITGKGGILTDSAESFLVSLFINQNTNDVYAAYAKGTAVLDLVAIFYKKSTDGMATWGGETAMQADAEGDERWISCGAVKAAWGGKFQPVWFNDDLNDMFTNVDNGISIAAAGGILRQMMEHEGG